MFIVELGLVDFVDYDLSMLCIGIMVGLFCLVEVMKCVVNEMYMVEVVIVYGMIEILLVLMMICLDDDFVCCIEMVGCTMLYLEFKVVDLVIGFIVLCGEAGELCICGYMVMLGYWNELDKIVEVIDVVCWMYIGDFVTMDVDGYVNIVGWIKDFVICGGENVYSCEVEEFLYMYFDVVDVLVVGVLDEKYGEEFMVWVVMKLGVELLTIEVVCEFCFG